MCAMGEKQFVSMLDSCDTQMVTVFKTKYIERLREYYFVGGMPEVVKDFSEKRIIIVFVRFRRILLIIISGTFQSMQK